MFTSLFPLHIEWGSYAMGLGEIRADSSYTKRKAAGDPNGLSWEGLPQLWRYL